MWPTWEQKMFNLAIQSLSKDTMDTSSQHTIPMQAFCFQLPGIGAPPARVKCSVFEVRGPGTIAVLCFLKDGVDPISLPNIFCVCAPLTLSIGYLYVTSAASPLQSLGFIKQASPEPGDFLRLLLYNPRVPLSETINAISARAFHSSNAYFASI